MPQSCGPPNVRVPRAFVTEIRFYRILSNVSNDFEDIITWAQHPFEVAVLPKLIPSRAPICERGSLPKQRHRRSEIGINGGAPDQQMNVVVHEGISKNFELAFSARAQNLLCDKVHNLRILEAFPTLGGRTGDEVAVFSFVRERFQPRRPSTPHAIELAQ